MNCLAVLKIRKRLIMTECLSGIIPNKRKADFPFPHICRKRKKTILPYFNFSLVRVPSEIFTKNAPSYFSEMFL